MKHMEMRGDFLSQRSVKQAEGQNPIGRKKGQKKGKKRENERGRKKDKTINKRKLAGVGRRDESVPPFEADLLCFNSMRAYTDRDVAIHYLSLDSLNQYASHYLIRCVLIAKTDENQDEKLHQAI